MPKSLYLTFFVFALAACQEAPTDVDRVAQPDDVAAPPAASAILADVLAAQP